MTVYADVLVIVNLYIDFFLLWCVQKFLSLQVSTKRLLAGAVVGGFLSLTALLPITSPVLSLLLSLCTAVAVTAATVCPIALPMLLRASACFLVCSFSLAGFFLLLLQVLAPKNIAVLGSVLYFDLSPGMLFAFTALAYVIFRAARVLLPPSTGGLRLCTLRIEHHGTTVELTAKADTGCSLSEPFSGLPVILCESTKVRELTPKKEELRIVPFSSLGGSGVLAAFRPQRVTMLPENRELLCFLALSEQPLSAGQFHALYNPDRFH